MMHHIAIIPGDGIGPEITKAALMILEATGIPFQWEMIPMGESAREEFGTPLPNQSLERIRELKVAMKAPLIVPKGAGSVIVQRDGLQRRYSGVNAAVRAEMGCFANLRPIRSLRGVQSRYTNIDLVVVREITEDVYTGMEHQITEDVAALIKVITRQASERIFRFASDYATRAGRRKITAGHKANNLSLTDGLFLRCGQRMVQEYPGLEFEDLNIDNLCYQLVRNPESFDVLVLPNQYGDIVSDLCAGLVGSLGIAPGGNFGTDVVFFEAVHGAAPDIAGKGIANPVAFILSGAMMLDYLGLAVESNRLFMALEQTLEDPENRTPDIGGRCKTMEFAQKVADILTKDKK
ncbi:MAG: isocitrate/isopropylmalate dehydrogenase family protein [Deltaproteobacteria bacterium]|nr:isocitrate/isopropylmalate dehydrogenase family protein [Deltaproteobacteria bacterium]